MTGLSLYLTRSDVEFLYELMKNTTGVPTTLRRKINDAMDIVIMKNNIKVEPVNGGGA